MGYLDQSLTFSELRAANIKRLPLFKNKQGVVCHNQDGSDWSEAQWFEALVGEIGEYANWHKKMVRGDMPREEALLEMKKELADVMTYLDILAFRLNIDLGEAVKSKFNEVSDRVGVDVKL